ncbi:hypothetical protein AAF712_006747 [Marasmius tenuissimus]|uniref:Arrestin C-terminal-like domain-containing protein n=1 Tax=Marasmius tenuissimus TaxID=585030 RepID=A0ABR2ZZ26_9AGAR
MPSSITSTTASTSKSRPTRRQNSLSIQLAESVVFLRTNDATGRNRYGDSQTSIVRGLLVLDVVKPMKISAIELELTAKSATAWPEGVGAHRTDITELHRVFEARDVVWSAAGYSGWRANNSKGKKAHDTLEADIVEEEAIQLDPEEDRPPSYPSIEPDNTLNATNLEAPSPSSPSFASILTPSSFSSARLSTSTASTSATSAFTMSTSMSTASTRSSLLSNVKPFEEGLPKTISIPLSVVPHAHHSLHRNTPGTHPSHAISRPPPFDDVPEHNHSNDAHVIYPNINQSSLYTGQSVVAHANTPPTILTPNSIPRIAPARPDNELSPAANSTLPLVPNRPVLPNAAPASILQPSSTPSADPGPEVATPGRVNQTKKRRFSIFGLVSSLFGSKKRRKQEKEREKESAAQAADNLGTDINAANRDVGRPESRSVSHSRSRVSMTSSGGVTVASEETVKPKAPSSRASSIFRGKRRSNIIVGPMLPLPPPPTSPPPAPISSAASVQSVPLPSSTPLPRPAFSSAASLNHPSPTSSYIPHPYSSSHPASATSQSSESSASNLPSPGITSSSATASSKRTSLIGFRENFERRRERARDHEDGVGENPGHEDVVSLSDSSELPVWKEFRKGTYTYPITFRIPGHAPPTLECTYGNVSWRIKGVVRRYGTFASNLNTTSPLLVVSTPAPLLYSPSAPTDPFYGALEENILVERHWDNQLHYSINVSGRSFHVGPGATIGVDFTFVPLSRGVRVWRVGVGIEEKTEYLTQFRRVARTDPVSSFPLLSLRDHNTYSKDQKWILPIPEGVKVEESPLHDVLNAPICNSGVDSSPGSPDVEELAGDVEEPVETRVEYFAPSSDSKHLPLDLPRSLQRQRSTAFLLRQREETIQSLQSPYGPWSFHADLPLPSSCRVMRPSNRNRRSNMNVTHILKCVVRVERGDDEDSGDDFSSKSSKERKKRKLFDIVIQTPIQILSCRCSPEYTSLPHYSEQASQEDTDCGLSMMCPCQRNNGSVPSFGRPGSFTGSTWSAKDKRASVASIGSGGRSVQDKRSSVSSIGSVSSIPPVPQLPLHLQTASRRSSLAFSIMSGTSTATAFSTMPSTPPIGIPGETLAERNQQLERLISGAEWEDGGIVPPYSV